MKDMGNGIGGNDGEVYMIMVVMDEGGEEVREMGGSVKGEVMGCSLDEGGEGEVKIGGIVVEKGKGMVEWGEEVVILVECMSGVGGG